MTTGELVFVILSVGIMGTYFISAILGIVRPKTFLRLQRSQAKWFGKFFGFKAKPYPDEVLCKRMRRWSIFCLIFGVIFLFLIWKDMPK